MCFVARRRSLPAAGVRDPFEIDMAAAKRSRQSANQ